MKVFAIIPACEGSDILPNKNLRLIDGKPLIYYPIRAAHMCSAIDAVLVTTNSKEIVTIARKMGVDAFLRDPHLCSKEVSIDEVIHDAVQQLPIQPEDIVVSIQSICPTIRSQMLEEAIVRCKRDDLDTLISAVKMQRPFWQYDKNGTAIPFYPHRPNRHKLTPIYVETGAFCITKARFIRPESMLGEHVELMEVSGSETVSIDTFGDLKQAESVIQRKKIAFFVNGNNLIGLGHVHRVLQIADELSDRPDIYYDKTQTDPAVFGNAKHTLIGVEGTEGLMQSLSSHTYDLVINDVLSTSKAYMLALRTATPASRLINFEDEGDGAPYADCVINALYEQSCEKNAYVGSRYYVIPKIFLLYEPITIGAEVKNILLTFGGADPCGYTEMLLDIAIRPEFSRYHFHVVLGRAKKNVDALSAYRAYPNISVYHDIDTMPELMSACDIAVTSRGRTGFELAFLGIPTISIAQNEREERHDFMSAENGFAYFPQHPSPQAVEETLAAYAEMSAEKRRVIQKKMLSNDLRNGRKNILARIDNCIMQNK